MAPIEKELTLTHLSDFLDTADTHSQIFQASAIVRRLVRSTQASSFFRETATKDALASFVANVFSIVDGSEYMSGAEREAAIKRAFSIAFNQGLPILFLEDKP